MHERPVRRIDWSPVIRYGGAYGGLAIIVYFVYQIVAAKHITTSFKIGVTTVIALITIAGVSAILQREPVADDPRGEGQRLYTAEEVAELLNAVRASGGRFVEAASNAPATCIFCGKPDANVRGLDGTRYHRPCFQRAYLERQDQARHSSLLR